jgi:hypothetical protein
MLARISAGPRVLYLGAVDALPSRVAGLLLSALLLPACGEAAGGTTGSAVSSGTPVARGPTAIAVDGDSNRLFWDTDTGTLYIAADDNNRILTWTDHDGLGLGAELPPAPPDGAGLGQVVKTKDGALVVPRFGFGTSGAVVFARPDATTGTVPGLDTLRRRIGLTIGGSRRARDGPQRLDHGQHPRD